MKLLELLVKELPGRGGWNINAHGAVQDNSGQVWFYKNGKPDFAGVIWAADNNSNSFDWVQWDLRFKRSEDYNKSIVTREQYEAAIAAQKPIAEFHSRTFPKFKAITVVERDDSWVGTNVDGEAYHCYKRYWDIEFISDQPVWNGEGLPPVGVKCEWQDYNTKKWTPVRVVYSSEWVTIISEDKDDDAIELAIENYGDKGRRKFRQILTEAERKRDAAGLAIYNAINWNAEGEMVSTSRMEDYRKAYDAIAAGKIPGVELSK